ncbi:MAG: aminodeoxychorismate/anthranilate synthase component II [Nocardioidaceae bacterium]
MPRVLVIDHHDSYTYNLVHLIASVSGSLPDVVQHDAAEGVRWRNGYSHIVLSPGPGTVTDPDDFRIGREVIERSDVPVLGVCLGMQAMVDVLGGEVAVVAPAHGVLARIEHTQEGVFRALPQNFSAVRYHSQATTSVAPGLAVTAWCDGAEGKVVMGIQHVERSLHGVQFHPESILTEHGATIVGNFLAME